MVEDGSFRTPEVAEEIKRLVKAGLGELPAGSQVVLGCTHYIFLKELRRETLGDGVEILEPSEAVARQVGRVGGDTENGSQILLLSTDTGYHFKTQATALLDCRDFQFFVVEQL